MHNGLQQITSPPIHDRYADDRGFTMIELLVAMILLLIVMSVIIMALIDGFRASNDAAITQKSEQVVSVAVSKLTADLRSARAEDRNLDAIRNPRTLGLYLLDGTIIQDASDPTVNLQNLDDVAIAEPGRFAFYTDDDASNPGHECVRYETSDAGGGMWQLERFVGFANCNATNRRQTIISPQAASLAEFFSYELMTPLAPGCPSRGYVASATGRDLHLISTVRISVASEIERADVSSSSSLTGAASIRTRQNNDYRIALGCEGT